MDHLTCVSVFSSHSFWTSGLLDVPAGVTQEEGHTRFPSHLPSAVHALIFLARRIQPFLSFVGREVEFCVLTIQSFSTCWAFFFSEEKSQLSGFELTSPTCQKVSRLPTELPGRPVCASLSQTHYWYEVGMLKVRTAYQSVHYLYKTPVHIK